MEPKPRNNVDPDVLEQFHKYRRLPLILGVFPLRFDNTGLSASLFGVVSSLITMSCLLCCFSVQLFALHTDYYSEESSSKVASSYFNYGAVTVTIVSHLWSIVLQRKRLVYVIRTVSGVKRYLGICGVSWKAGQRFCASVVQGVSLACITLLDPLTYDSSVFGTANTLSYYYSVETLIWISTQFMWFADSLTEGFRGLLEMLHQTTTTGDVEFLVKRHYLLTEASGNLNEAYCLGLTLTFVSSFVMFLSTSYKMILNVIEGSSLRSVLALFFLDIVLLLLLFRIVHSCVGVTYQAKRFDGALYKLLVYKSPSNITQKSSTLRLFFHFSAKTDVAFTLSGFFKLDWHLLYSMLAAGCTYLVVIVQMNHLS